MKDNKEKIIIIPLEKILPNRFQPRIKFSEESILNLADSIKEHGILQPIIVRSIGDKYEIVAGERRYKATVLAGLQEIPALLFDINDKDSAEVALIENVQRKDLSPIEEAISYKKILDMGYLTQSDLASKIGVSQSAVANKIRLLNLCDDVQEALLDEKISERHARSLLKIDDLDIQAQMLKRILSKKLTVRALDDEIDYYKKNKKFKEIENVDKLNESKQEPVIEIKNTSFDEKLKDGATTDTKSEDVVSKNDDKVQDKKESLKKLDLQIENDKSIFEDISIENDLNENNQEEVIAEESVLEEKKGENDNDMNNNLLNMNEDMNYNTLKNTGGTPGKFFMNTENIAKEEPKEEKSIFNFDNSNNTGNIFSDLMAPQGSKNLFRPGTTQESVIPTSNEEQKNEDVSSNSTPNVSSMFENLMGVSTSSSEEIDKDTFNKFMDPSFVDGEKQDTTTNSENISSNVFSKFLVNNDEQNAETKNDKKESANNNSGSNIFQNLLRKSDTNNQPKEDSTSNVSIFSNVFDSNKKEEVKVEENVNEPAAPSSIFNFKKEESVSDNTSNIQIPTVEIEQKEEIKSSDDIFKTNDSEKKPDLLAPMGDESSNQQITLNPSFDDIKIDEPKEENTTVVSNDLSSLSPMQNNLDVSVNDEPVETSNEEESNDTLTIDKTIEEEKKDEKIEETNNVEPTEKEKEDLITFNTTKPIFVTASSEENVSSMPTSPIIDVPEEPTEEAEKVELPEPAPVVTSLEIDEPAEEVEEDINNMIGNQPIIVTDYNKQYDPVIPDAGPQVEKIEFKKILSLIRELSETIEKCGYEIDTDEIDLQDKYQVIFNINKQ